MRERVGIFTLNYRYSTEPIYPLHRKIMKIQTGLDVQYGTEFDHLESRGILSDYLKTHVQDISDIPFFDLEGLLHAIEITYIHAMFFQKVLFKNKNKYDYIVIVDMDCYFKRKDSLEYLISLTENKTVAGISWHDVLQPISEESLDKNELFGHSLDHLKDFSREELLEVKHRPKWLHAPTICIPTHFIDKYHLDNDDMIIKAYGIFTDDAPENYVSPDGFYPSNLNKVFVKYLKERYLEEPYNEIKNIRDHDHSSDAPSAISQRIRYHGIEPRFITDEEMKKYFVHCHGYSYMSDDFDYGKFGAIGEYSMRRKEMTGTKEKFIRDMIVFLENLEKTNG